MAFWKVDGMVHANTYAKGRARTVAAQGPAVGLPTDDDMGNSEVGHNALGSGQVVAQGAKLVDNIDKMNIAYSAFILLAFIAAGSARTLLLQQCNTGTGYTFVYQTVMMGPFFMQVVSYTAQTCKELGFAPGIRELVGAWKHMGPAIFYSIVVSLGTMLQTLSLNYIDASTYIVLLQLVLVFVALGERFVLKQKSICSIWLLICLQAVCVVYYEVSGVSNASSSKGFATQADANANLTRYLMGMGICLVSCFCMALGTILQQRFLQSATTSVAILPSVKLCYQHIIGFLLMTLAFLADPSSVEAIWKDGFFHGWTGTTVLASVTMWLSFFTASSVTAYVSAMAGAMGSAVVVIIVGICGSIIEGKSLSAAQSVVICTIAIITTLYTLLKFQMLAAAEEARIASVSLNALLLAREP